MESTIIHTEIARFVAGAAVLVLVPIELEVFQVSFVGEAAGDLLSEFFQQRLCFDVQLGRRRRRRRGGGSVFVWNDIEVRSRFGVGQVVGQLADVAHEAQCGCVAGSGTAQHPALDLVFRHYKPVVYPAYSKRSNCMLLGLLRATLQIMQYEFFLHETVRALCPNSIISIMLKTCSKPGTWIGDLSADRKNHLGMYPIT